MENLEQILRDILAELRDLKTILKTNRPSPKKVTGITICCGSIYMEVDDQWLWMYSSTTPKGTIFQEGISNQGYEKADLLAVYAAIGQAISSPFLDQGLTIIGSMPWLEELIEVGAIQGISPEFHELARDINGMIETMPAAIPLRGKCRIADDHDDLFELVTRLARRRKEIKEERACLQQQVTESSPKTKKLSSEQDPTASS